MNSLRRRFLAGLIGLLVGLPNIASAMEYGLELIRVTTGSANGASDAISLDTTGAWAYDDTTGVVTLSGTMQADFDINPLPNNELFSHTMADVAMDLNGMSISGAAYACIEGTFGATVGAHLCANTNYGGNFLSETTWDYSMVPGTRIVSGDDVAAGPQQQLTDYASQLNLFDGSLLVIESPLWAGNPGVEGIQLEFSVTNAPSLRDIPDVIGLRRNMAEAELIARGLTVGTVSMTNDPGVPAGSVISQNPFTCEACANLNDSVDLVVSLGPLSVLTIPEQIDDLVEDVHALGLRSPLDQILVRLLHRASEPFAVCGDDQSIRSQDQRARRCQNGGKNKAAQRLNTFMRVVEAQHQRRIAPADVASLIASARGIVAEIMREPPVTGLYTMVSGGVERTYFLRVPENYSQYGDPQPIIFGFHGATGTWLDWFEGGFHGDGLQEEVGDQAIMVFPQALESTGGITLWNSMVDFEFFADLLARLQDELAIDPNRIFATGHSAGGGFSHQLGCQFGDVLRGIAPSSGFLLERECIGSVAVLQMQSTFDMVANVELVKLSRDVWVAYNGYNLDTFSDGIVDPCVDYSLGTSLYPVQWCEHASTGADGHQWWDGADAAIWRFFSGLPTAVPTTEPPPGGGNDRILEALPASLSFTVRYPANMNEVTLLTAVLYPAGTEQPIFNAPLWFLNGEIPFTPATPGTAQTYENVPISLFASSQDMPLPGTYTLSIGVFVEGGSFPIPASGIDHIALIDVEIQDQFLPIIVDEILDLVPVQGF
jgi:polyhydroxybutyrate depolymerase